MACWVIRANGECKKKAKTTGRQIREERDKAKETEETEMADPDSLCCWTRMAYPCTWSPKTKRLTSWLGNNSTTSISQTMSYCTMQYITVLYNNSSFASKHGRPTRIVNSQTALGGPVRLIYHCKMKPRFFLVYIDNILRTWQQPAPN